MEEQVKSLPLLYSSSRTLSAALEQIASQPPVHKNADFILSQCQSITTSQLIRGLVLLSLQFILQLIFSSILKDTILNTNTTKDIKTI